jgi:hypothetical protein
MELSMGRRSLNFDFGVVELWSFCVECVTGVFEYFRNSEVGFAIGNMGIAFRQSREYVFVMSVAWSDVFFVMEFEYRSGLSFLNEFQGFQWQLEGELL